MSQGTLAQTLDRLKELGARISVVPPEEGAWDMHLEHIAPFITPQGKRRPGKGDTAINREDPRTVIGGELPPWGQLDDALMADIKPPIPLDWRLGDDEWWSWLTSIIRDIGSLIWPVYQPGAWSDATVGRILDADFSLLAELRPCLGLPIKSVFPTIIQHSDLFKDEDDRTLAFGTGYQRYDPTLPEQVLECFTTVLTAGIVDKVGSLDLLLKLVFQRPRAYQVALLQGRQGFSYQSAATANTPSLVSGHCLQASLAGCTVFSAFAVPSSLNATSIKTLQQFTVDVGDRRVFAGVHYPSDNLASWFTALQLVPHVFDEPAASDAKAFLWEAINSRSVVFDAVKRHVNSNSDSPYRRAFEAIQSIAN